MENFVRRCKRFNGICNSKTDAVVTTEFCNQKLVLSVSREEILAFV